MPHISSHRISLRMAVGSLVTLLLIALGVTLTLYSFETQKQSTLQKIKQIFTQTALITDEKLASMLIPVRTFVEITSKLPNLTKGNINQYQEYLPYISQNIRVNDGVSSVYVGYDDGSFYMLSEVPDDSNELTKINAPKGTAFYLKEMIQQKDILHLKESFFDENIHCIEKRQSEGSIFDPRKRLWYQGAATSTNAYITDPYRFHTSGHIGYTISKTLADHSGVVGVDISIQKLITVLQEQRHTPSTQLLLFRADGRVLLSSNPERLQAILARSKYSRDIKLTLDDLQNPVMQEMYNIFHKGQNRENTVTLTVKDKKWLCSVQRLAQISNRQDVFIAMISPFSEIMADAITARFRNSIILGVAIFIAILIGLIFSKRLSLPLQNLSGQSAAIRQFRLDVPISVQSSIKEVAELATNMVVMQSAISRFVEIARALSAEKKMERVLEMILDEAVNICQADGGGIGLVSDDETSLSYVLVKNKKLSIHYGGESKNSIDLPPILLGGDQSSIENGVKTTGKSFTCADVSKESMDFSVLQTLHQGAGYQCKSILVIPLLNRQDEMIGVLHMVNARSSKGEIQPFSSSRTAYVEALSSNAALALDNNRLIRAQKDLFDSFVRLIATAIDTKSPYTGGHCQRVPVIASMLADAASSSTDAVFADFTLSEEEKYELHVASWLHDCGKVTTPEYVVDKATKLETIYNRIHEVRTRFEVLWRDTEVTYLKGILAEPEKKEIFQEELGSRQQQLQDDFKFIAECNLGGEFMAPELIKRLRDISGQTWKRHFDDRIGLSDDELARFNNDPHQSLPCTEQVLANKNFQIFKRLKETNDLAFCMKKPQLLYNQGELYNLEIKQGTLTKEERYKINHHVVQSINMLSSLPFPKEIRRVPSWAGNHHEKLDGTGYPRCLTAEQLSFPERIMAIADIFEALSASDRPYKKPKKLSQCVKIMSFMRKDGHICPDLFELFLTSGIYLQYAKKYMRPDQVDEVILTNYISFPFLTRQKIPGNCRSEQA